MRKGFVASVIFLLIAAAICGCRSHEETTYSRLTVEVNGHRYTQEQVRTCWLEASDNVVCDKRSDGLWTFRLQDNRVLVITPRGSISLNFLCGPYLGHSVCGPMPVKTSVKRWWDAAGFDEAASVEALVFDDATTPSDVTAVQFDPRSTLFASNIGIKLMGREFKFAVEPDIVKIVSIETRKAERATPYNNSQGAFPGRPDPWRPGESPTKLSFAAAVLLSAPNRLERTK